MNNTALYSIPLYGHLLDVYKYVLDIKKYLSTACKLVSNCGIIHIFHLDPPPYTIEQL